MTIKTVQQAFEEFERHSVRVPDEENQAAKTVQAAFREAVKRWLGERYGDSFLAGSYRRKTQAVHLKDLDIIIVLNDPTGELRASADGTLAVMKQAATAYEVVGAVTTKCRAVECELSGYPFWADLVPALEDGAGGLLLAYVDKEEGVNEWRPADPKGQTQACQAKNDQTDGDYVPVTRIAKFWNQSFTSSSSQEKPLPSYLIEAILHDALHGAAEWPDAAVAFFERADYHLSLPAPSVPCPSQTGENVDEKLEDYRRVQALAKVRVALAAAHEAAAQTDPRRSMDLWVKVFGPSFPAPSTHPSLIAQTLHGRGATLAGVGITATQLGRRPIPARSHGPARAHS
jgi:hypothetical protein